MARQQGGQRAGGLVIASRIKASVCATISMLPVTCWPLASATVRRIWPGFRNA